MTGAVVGGLTAGWSAVITSRVTVMTESSRTQIFKASWNIKPGVVVLVTPAIIVAALGTTAPDAPAAARVLFAALGVVALGLALAWGRSHLVVRSNEIVIRGMARRRRIAISDVATVEVRSNGIGWRTPALQLRRGTTVVIGFICDAGGRQGPATRAVDAISEALERTPR